MKVTWIFFLKKKLEMFSSEKSSDLILNYEWYEKANPNRKKKLCSWVLEIKKKVKHFHLRRSQPFKFTLWTMKRARNSGIHNSWTFSTFGPAVTFNHLKFNNRCGLIWLSRSVTFKLTSTRFTFWWPKMTGNPQRSPGEICTNTASASK